MTTVPATVRILPMSETDPEFPGWSVQQVQEEFFLARLPNRGGRFLFPTNALKEEQGALVLFQFKNQVIASAVLMEAQRYEAPIIEDGASYQGEYRFDPASIRVFDPISREQMRQFWPEFRQFSQVKQTLSPDAFLAFAQSLASVRAAVTSLDDDDAADDEHVEYIPTDEDLRAATQAQIRLRRGQRAFRELLRTQYDDRCAITGCRTLGVLEAAHISPYLGEKDNHATNGLLLRADLHTLFDLNLLGIEPNNLTIEVHPRIAHDYGFLAGQTLQCMAVKLSPAALEARYRLFQSRLKRS